MLRRFISTMLIALGMALFVFPLSMQDDELPLVTNGDYEAFLFANQNTEFVFIGSQGDSVTIEVLSTSGTADMLLELYGPDGNLLFSDDDSGDRLDPLITNLPLPQTGEYRIVVTRCSFCDEASSAGFTLTVSGLSGEQGSDDASQGTADEPQADSSDEIVPECDFAAYQDALNASLNIVEAGSDSDILENMNVLAETIRQTRISCLGLTYSSEDYGQQPAIGPVEFGSGIYLACYPEERRDGVAHTS